MSEIAQSPTQKDHNTNASKFPELDRIYSLQKNNLQTLKNRSARERIKAIDRIRVYLSNEENQELLCKAMYQDFGKPTAEVRVTELVPTLSHITEIKRNLHRWMRNSSHPVPIQFIGLNAKSKFEPKGQALVIAPWNYPFFLSIYPALYAIAAGCSVILKPSELTPTTSAFIEKMFHELFEPAEVRVFQGEISITTAMLNKKWGHIFFTGSPAVGKIVMEAASKTLSSVSLELGGKSPCVLDESANVPKMVERLAWGKFVNAGQTCIAPDYVMVHESKRADFEKEIKRVIEKFYGEKPKQSEDLARIISTKHTQRLEELINESVTQGAKVIVGGKVDVESKYVSPTIVINVDSNMKLMQEEIFGPILPVIYYSSNDEVIQQINRLEKPLSMYILSSKRKNIEYFTNNTSAGGTLVNEFLLGAAIPSVPFGGVNNSGIGKAYSLHGFLEFSNERAVVKRSFMSIKFIYPPYSPRVQKIIGWLKRFS